jgi:hypothetical protein
MNFKWVYATFFACGLALGVTIVIVIVAFAPDFLMELVPVALFGVFLIGVVSRVVVAVLEKRKEANRD